MSCTPMSVITIWQQGRVTLCYCIERSSLVCQRYPPTIPSVRESYRLCAEHSGTAHPEQDHRDVFTLAPHVHKIIEMSSLWHRTSTRSPRCLHSGTAHQEQDHRDVFTPAPHIHKITEMSSLSPEQLTRWRHVYGARLVIRRSWVHLLCGWIRCGHVQVVPRCGHVQVVPRCGHVQVVPNCFIIGFEVHKLSGRLHLKDPLV